MFSCTTAGVCAAACVCARVLQYLEIDIDISANNVASYVTGLVRGATRSLVIDMGFVLEGGWGVGGGEGVGGGGRGWEGVGGGGRGWGGG